MARRATTRKVAHKPKSRLGTVGKTAAFLAGPFPDVELLIGTMANPDSGIKFVLGIAKKAGRRVSEVQSVIFDKLKWTADAAKQWLKENGFTGSGKDEGATFWRFRQQSPGKFKEFRTIVPGTSRNPEGEGSHFAILDGVRVGLGTNDKVIFSTDWEYLWKLAAKGDARLIKQSGGPSTYGHTDLFYIGKKARPYPSEENPVPGAAGPHSEISMYAPNEGDVTVYGRDIYTGAWHIIRGASSVGEAKEWIAAHRFERPGHKNRWAVSGLESEHGEGAYSPVQIYRRIDGLSRVVVQYAEQPHGGIAQENPDVSDAITSYDEHLGMTTRPEFRSATPDEQAAAMTAMDLAENPNVPTPVEIQPPFSPARVRDFGLTLVHQLGGEPRNYLHEVGVRAADDDALQYLKDAGYHESTGWLDRTGAQWWAYRKEYPLSVAKWAEQNPRRVLYQDLQWDVMWERDGQVGIRVTGGRETKVVPVSAVEWPSAEERMSSESGDALERFAAVPREFRPNPDPMGSGPMKTRKLLLIDVKFTKSAEKLGRIIGVAREQGWPEVVEAAEAKAKRLKIRPETLEGHAAKIVPWRNPESEAAALYEEFHGKPPGETLEIVTDKLEHEWLTQLGLLVELKVATLTNLEATLCFDKDAPNLCSSEDGRQLYIEGGDQALDLKPLKMDADKWLKDSMVIGVAYELTYQTEKGFQNFKLTDYYHKLGEETGVQPFLLYDPRNQLLSISGGQYQVKDVGIVN